MSDTLSPEQRSEHMRRIRRQDTKPEMLVRRWLHAKGYRYRLHDGKLPGRPDLVFPSRKKVVFVHGCFWHSHENCALATVPKSRPDFWIPKLHANVARDQRKVRELRASGWDVLVVWQCELRDMQHAGERIVRFLDG